jgi:glyoxylase-like metal-dependent hydrolase (beta-lactamase superfamily II)
MTDRPSGWPDALPRPGNRRLTQLEGAAAWFNVFQVSRGTYALLEPHHYEEVISYLVLGSERALLFDTGMGIGDIRAEVKRLTELPVVTVNSHSHYDHVGDNHRFAQGWAFDHDGEVARIEGGLTAAECVRFLPAGSYRDLPPGFDPAAYLIQPSPVTRRLQHLEVIDLGGRALTVHHTPGHSPGSICLLDARDGLLLTGDTFYPGMLYAHFEGSDFGAYRRSLHHLVGLLEGVSHLCPAHNEACVPKVMLAHAADAFEEIVAGLVEPDLQDNLRVFRFQGFGLTLPRRPGGSA